MSAEADHQPPNDDGATVPPLEFPDVDGEGVYDFNEPEARVMATTWWPAFEIYMQTRRLQGADSLELSKSGEYPLSAPPNATQQERARVLKSLAFMTADALIQHDDRPLSAGEIDRDQAETFLAQRPMDIPHSLSSEEMRLTIETAFLLAFTYRTSDVRRLIERELEKREREDLVQTPRHRAEDTAEWSLSA